MVSDTPVIASSSNPTTEDVRVRIPVTPDVFQDCDFSETLTKLVCQVSAPFFFHDYRFQALGGTTSSIDSMTYTLDASSSSVLTRGEATMLSLSFPVHCDVDFTLTAKVHSSSVQTSTTVSVGLLVSAAADSVSVTAAATSTFEDSSVNVRLTPTLIDTDQSERVHRVSLVGNVEACSFSSLLGWRSEVLSSTYVLTHSGTGSVSGGLIPAFSLTPQLDCDIDFTLTAFGGSVEENNMHTLLGGAHSVTFHVSVACEADDPTALVGNPHLGTENTVTKLRLTPAVSDTDGSESINRLVLSGIQTGSGSVVDLSRFTFSTSATSGATAVDFMRYTLNAGSSGFFPSTSMVSLSVLPSKDCDVDFTLTVFANVMEANGVHEKMLSTGEAFEVEVAASPHVPSIAVASPVQTYEGVGVSLKVTPEHGLSPDTDGSELAPRLEMRDLVVAAGVHPDLSKLSFSGLPVTTSGASSHVYTLSHASSFTLETLVELTVTPAAHCDLDFTLTAMSCVVEQNGLRLAPSAGVPVGVEVEASMDSSEVIVTTTPGQTTEDVLVQLAVTPSESIDTDGSVKMYSLHEFADQDGDGVADYTGLRYLVYASSVSTYDAAGYQLTLLHTGFAYSQLVAVSVSPPIQCDLDFTLSLTVKATEANGLAGLSLYQTTAEFQLFGDADAGSVVTASAETTEDFSTAIHVTPTPSIDSDGSEKLSNLIVRWDSVDYRGFTGLVSTTSQLTAMVCTITPSVGFDANVMLPSFEVKDVAQCDLDFTLSLSIASVEANSGVRYGPSQGLGIQITATTDAPEVDSLSSYSVPEDTVTSLAVTPKYSSDTDFSEVIRKLQLRDPTPHALTGVNFLPISSTSSSISLFAYILSVVGSSGFAAGVRIPSLSLVPIINGDVDFTLSARATASESNDGTTVDSTTKSIGIALTAVTDGVTTPGFPSGSVTEDHPVADAVTPSLIDSDESEAVYLMTLQNPLLDPATNLFRFRGISGTTSEVLSGSYFLSAASWFALDAAIAISVTCPSDCDIDFSLTGSFATFERNDAATQTSDASIMGVEMIAEADLPTIETLSATLLTPEDQSLPLRVTSFSGGDTDMSELPQKVYVSGFDSGVSFAVIPSTSSVLNGAIFTLSHGGVWDQVISGLCISPAAQSDLDFTVSVWVLSIERNGVSERSSTTISVGIEVDAVADVPTLSVSATETMEDVHVAVDVFPDTVDSDASETLYQLSITGFGLGLRFSSLPSTQSMSSGTVYTVSLPDGFPRSGADAVSGLSITPAVDCDIDFELTFSCRVSDNGDLATSLGYTASVVLGAAADVPTMAVEGGVGTEDSHWGLQCTPSVADTDSSEILSKLVLYPGAVFVSSVESTVSSQGLDTYTLTIQGSGLVSDSRISGISLAPLLHCDIDFSFTGIIFSTEVNNGDQTTSAGATSHFEITAMADAPDISFSVSSIVDTSVVSDGKTDAVSDEKADAVSDEKADAVSDEKADAVSDEKADAVSDEKADGAVSDGHSDAKAEADEVANDANVNEDAAADANANDAVAVSVGNGRAYVLAEAREELAVELVSDGKTDAGSDEKADVVSDENTEVSVEKGEASVSGSSISEDTKFLCTMKVSLLDTDFSESLVALTASSSVIPQISFAALNGTNSIVSSTTYALTSLVFSTEEPLEMDTSPACQCDIDFTLTWLAFSSEQNGLDQEASSAATGGIKLEALVETPTVAALPSTETIEDGEYSVRFTPGASVDTDASEMINSLRVWGLQEQGVSFSAVVSTKSSIASGEYELLEIGTGFAHNVTFETVANVVPDCDVDFTLSLLMVAEEGNGGDAAKTTTQSIGVSVIAVVDEPHAALDTPRVTFEDISTSIRLTPLSSDTDSSDWMDRFVAHPVFGVSFTSALYSVSLVSAAWYTVTIMGPLVSSTHVTRLYSLTPPVQCDVDFTLSMSILATEQNGLTTAQSTSASVGVGIDSVSDEPSLLTTVLNTSEDFRRSLSLSPSYGNDTDMSEEPLSISFWDFSGVIDKVKFSGIQGTASDVVGNTYYYLYSVGTTFTFEALPAYSVSPAAQCDIDFSFEVAISVLEANGPASGETLSPTASIDVKVTAVPDDVAVAVVDTGTVEDGCVAVFITPSQESDTDSSETLSNLIVDTFLPAPGIHDDSYTISATNGSVLTVTGGFRVDVDYGYLVSDATIAGLSVTPPRDCDVDFTFNVRLTSVEMNGGVEEIGLSKSLSIIISAVADTPLLLRPPSQQASEDILVPFMFTPQSSADTDASSSLSKLISSGWRGSLLAFGPVSSTSSASSYDSAVFTLSALSGVGFSSNAVLTQSASLAVQCDVDFTFSSTLFDVERNGGDWETSAWASIGLAVVACPDLPSVIRDSTEALEDQQVVFPFTPFSVDTDASEAMTKLLVQLHLGPQLRVSFAAVLSSTSAVDGPLYTLSTGGSGFAYDGSAIGLDLTPAVESDVDFTLSFAGLSIESNSGLGAWGEYTTVGIAIAPVVDGPTLHINPVVVFAEDVQGPLMVTPALGSDTDLSEPVLALVGSVFGEGPGTILSKARFSSVVATLSNVDSLLYTLASVGAGLSSGMRLLGYSIFAPPQSDIDFTLEFFAYAMESNSGEDAVTPTTTVGVGVSALSDPGVITVSPNTGGLEDTSMPVTMTPEFSADTDRSELLVMVSLTRSLAWSDVTSVLGTVSTFDSSGYTLTGTGSGFLSGFAIALSVTPHNECDLDFTMSVAVTSVEINGVDRARSLEGAVSIVVDPSVDPVAIVSAGAETIEDTPVAFLCTPVSNTDTDASERKHLLVTREAGLLGFSFSSIPSTRSSLMSGVYTLSFASSGFFAGAQLPSSSIFTPQQCDTDFTLVASIVAVERNDLSMGMSSLNSLGIVVSSHPDSPSHNVSVVASLLPEDAPVRISLTPSLGSDTDLSESLNTLRVSALEPAGSSLHHFSFSSVPGATSVVDAGGYTATGLPSFTSGAGFLLSVSPVGHCDVDFTLLSQFSSMEANSGAVAWSPAHALGVAVSAVPETPDIDVVEPLHATEDYPYPLALTPLGGSDTDGSDTLRRLAMSSAGALLSHFWFSPLAGCASSLTGEAFTLSGPSSGFASGGRLAGLSVMSAPECSVDFTLSVTAMQVEANGMEERTSGSKSLGVELRGAVDLPQLSAMAATSTKEDEAAALVVTPVSGGDTDLSDVTRAVVMTGTPLDLRRLRFAGVAGTVSSMDQDRYTVTSVSVSGFADSQLLPAFSVSPADACDRDFTLYASVAAVEANELATGSSTTRSIGVLLESVTDAPVFAVAAALGAVEDTWASVGAVLAHSDTDGSEPLRSLFATGVSTGASFSAVNGAISFLEAAVYTLSAVSGSGFGMGEFLALSLLGPVQCDIDFTVTTALVSLEGNTMVSAIGGVRTSGLAILAVCDEPLVEVPTTTSLLEDVGGLLQVTPRLPSDSDGSETLQKLGLRDFVPNASSVAKCSFSSVASTTSGVTQKGYTLTAAASGFRPGVLVPELTMTAPSSCDVDFSFSVHARSAESNGGCLVDSPVATVGVSLSCVVGVPILGISDSAMTTAEDHRAPVSVTPALDPDTDGSELLVRLYGHTYSSGTYVPAPGSVMVSGADADFAAGGVFTLSAAGQGFASGQPLQLSAVLAPACDRDFTLSVAAASLESNNRDQSASTLRTCGLSVTAVADEPGMAAASVVTATEDATVGITVTPSLSSDTDYSQMLRKVVYAGFVPGGDAAVASKVTFSGLVVSVSSTSSNAYTVTAAGLGFSGGFALYEAKVLAAAECDVDFSFSARVASVEVNGKDLSYSSDATVGIKVYAVGDEPNIEISNSVISVVEDVTTGLQLGLRPGTDTDGSDSISKISSSSQATLLGITFSAFPGSVSSVSSVSYTVSASFMELYGFPGDLSYNISCSVQCDVDFTLSFYSTSAETNNRATTTSTTVSVGIAVNATADATFVSALAIDSTEDVFTPLVVTPEGSVDTDSSEIVPTLMLFDRFRTVGDGMGMLTFETAPVVTVATAPNLFTLEMSGTGFAQGTVVAVSMSAEAECDTDFTLSVAVVGMERNGWDRIPSSSSSLSVGWAGLADVPLLEAAASTLTLEDHGTALLLTPYASGDTDSSELLAQIGSSVVAPVTFASISDTTSSHTSSLYTLQATDSDFQPGVSIAGMSAQASPQTDVDFTLTWFSSVAEANGFDEESSEGVLMGIVLVAVADAPDVLTLPSIASTEDVQSHLPVTPWASADSDFSEALLKLRLTATDAAVMAGTTFTADFAAAISESTAGCTITAGGTGFASGVGLLGFSVSHAPQCDFDFALTSVVFVVEHNGRDAAVSTESATALAVVASADQPGISVSPATVTSEDVHVAIGLTPALGADTDGSEALWRLAVGRGGSVSLAAYSFSSVNDTSSAVDPNRMQYTLTAGGSGFGSGARIAEMSVSGAVQCDVDFVLRVDVCLAELNGADEAFTAGGASIGISVGAACDEPFIRVFASTSTTEEVSVPLRVTPGLDADTDESEIIRSVLAIGVPVGITLAGVFSTASDAAAQEYTLSDLSEDGFPDTEILPDFGVVGAAQCDVDFRLTFRASSLEGNGGDAAASTVASVAVVVRAAADSPALLVDPSRGTTEDVRTALQITPLAGIDSDGSQALVAVSVAPLGSNFVFSLPANVSLAEQGSGYLLEGSFEVSGELPSFSVTSAAQCDSDFVLSFAVLAEERNGFDSAWSTSLSIGIEVAAVVDSPLLNVTAEHDTLRTDDTYVVTSLCGFADTDGSEALERMEVGGLTKDAVLTVGSEEVTAGIVPIEIDLLSDGIGGAITDDTVNVVLSISAPVFCDSDFSLTLSVAVVEANGGDALWSEAVLFPVDVAVVYDPCEYQLHDCDESATCQYVDDASYACACNSGYEGSGESCEDVNECTAGGHNCAGDADCSNADGSFFCVCKSQFYGDGVTCAACGGNATSPLGSLVASDCTCNSGYSGTAWDLCVDEDECASGSHTCVENAVCLNSLGSFSCSCASGYEGTPTKSCTDIDECDLENDCDPDAACSNSDGSYSCTCNDGYLGNGVSCLFCAENSVALISPDGEPYGCECLLGYEGDPNVSCEDVNECTLGSHNCDANASCANSDGSFSCACFDYFSGTGIEGNCTACAEHAVSSDVRNETSSTCVCEDGYKGDGFLYCVDVDECSSGGHACALGAVCANDLPGYHCYCPASYYGDGLTPCTPCASNATSLAGSLSASGCACNVGFVGDGISHCDEVDECMALEHNCAPEAECLNTAGSFICTCPSRTWGNGVEGCSSCAENAMSPAGSTSAEDCVCNDGYAGVGSVACELSIPVYTFVRAELHAPSEVDLSQQVELSVSLSTDCAAESCIFPEYVLLWGQVEGPSDSVVEEVLEASSAASSSTATIPPGALYPSSEFVFSVELCVPAFDPESGHDGLDDYCLSDSVRITTSGPCLTAAISTNAQNEAVTRKNSVYLDGSVSNAACANLTAPVSISWYEAGGAVDLSSETMLDVTLAPYTLVFDATYEFVLTACIGRHECVSGSTTITVVASNLVVFVSGGNRQLGLSDDLIIDATESLDPDAETEHTSWTCSQASRVDDEHAGLSLEDVVVQYQQECFPSEMSLVDSSGKTVRIQERDLSVGLYYFQFTLWTAVKAPEAHAILVEVLDSSVHETTIIGPVGQQNVNQQLVLTAYANGGVPTSVVWTLVSGQDLDLSSTAVVRTSRTSRILKLAEGVLDPSQSYRFRATTTSSSGESYAEFLVYTNAGPTVGTFSVSPGNGTAMETAFTLTVHDDWEDEEDDLPFSYKFVQVLASGKVKALSEYSPRSSLTTTLSASTEIGQTVQVRAYVRDQWGAASFSDVVQVAVVWPAVADDEVATFAGSVMDGEVATALARGDAEGAVNTVTTLGEFVNLYETDTASVREDMLGVVVDVSVSDASMSEESAGMYIEAATTLSTKPHTLSAAAVDLAYGVYRDIAALAADYSSGTTLASESVTESLEGLSSLLAVASDDPEQQADTADTLTETLGNLARAQLNGAVPGETPACAQAGSLLVGSQRVDHQSLHEGVPTLLTCHDVTFGVGIGSSLYEELEIADGEDPLDVSVVAYESDPYAFDEGGSGDAVTPIVAVNLLDADGSIVSVQELLTPMEITIPVVSPTASEDLTATVYFRDSPSTPWGTDDCVTLPNPRPLDVDIGWRQNVTGLPLTLAWEINLPVGCVDLSVKDVVDSEGLPLRIFGRESQSSDCWLVDEENEGGCYWDNEKQAFLGASCQLGDTISALCTHLTDFSGHLEVPDVHTISVSDFASLRSVDQVVVPVIIMLSGLGLMVLLGVGMTWRYERRRESIFRRWFDSQLGHKIVNGVDLWSFSLEKEDDTTSVSGSALKISKVVGIPLPRLLLALPSASRSLRPMEHSERITPDDSDLIGTMLAIAYIDAFDLATRGKIRSLIATADAYFSDSKSIYPICGKGSFSELVEKTKIMIHCNLGRVGWRQRSRVWKITFLQYPDGHWELTPALADSICPTTSSLVHCDFSVDRYSVVLESLPMFLREFDFKGVVEGPAVWATLLATVFLQRQKEFYIVQKAPVEITSSSLGYRYLESVVPSDLLQYWLEEAGLQLDAWSSKLTEDLHELRQSHQSKHSSMKRCFWKARHWLSRHHKFVRVWAMAVVGEATTKPGLMLSLFCVWAGLILTNVWFYYSRAYKCCENLKEEMCADDDADTPCYDDEYFDESTPSCGSLLDEYSSLFPRCDEFPNGTAAHRFWVTLISALLVVPVEKILLVILRKCMAWHVSKYRWVRLNYRGRLKRFFGRQITFFHNKVSPGPSAAYSVETVQGDCDAIQTSERRWLSARKLTFACYGIFVTLYVLLSFFTILYATLLYENIEKGADVEVFYVILQAFTINLFIGEINESIRQMILRVFLSVARSLDDSVMTWGETLTDGAMFGESEEVMVSDNAHMVDYFVGL